MCESQQCQDLSSAGQNHSETSEISHFEFPALDINKVGLAQGYLNSSSSLLSLPGHSILCKDTSSSLDFLFPLHPHKRPRESETTFPNSIGPRSMCDGFSSFAQDNTRYGKYNGHSSWSPSFGADLNINNNNPSPIDMLCGSHALNNGNSCSSKPISVAMKLELPSLQYSTSQVGSWAPSSSPLPSLESVDIIQSPLSDQTQSNCPSPRTSGLLDAIVYESHMKKLKTNSFPPISESPIDDDFLESSKWDVSGDSVSPVSQSTASVLLEYTPLSGSSPDEPQSAETMHGFKGNAETGNSVSADSHGGMQDFPSRLEDLRPDMLLDSCWLGFPGVAKDESIAGDIGTLFDDDQNFDEYVQQICSLSAESNQSNVAGSSPWENTTDMF